jgi:hypothetical protein
LKLLKKLTAVKSLGGHFKEVYCQNEYSLFRILSCFILIHFELGSPLHHSSASDNFSKFKESRGTMNPFNNLRLVQNFSNLSILIATFALSACGDGSGYTTKAVTSNTPNASLSYGSVPNVNSSQLGSSGQPGSTMYRPIQLNPPGSVNPPVTVNMPVAMNPPLPALPTTCWKPEARVGQGTDVTACPSVAGLNQQQLEALITAKLASPITISGDSNGSIDETQTLSVQMGTPTIDAVKNNLFPPTLNSQSIFFWGTLVTNIGVLIGESFSVNQIIQANIAEKNSADEACRQTNCGTPRYNFLSADLNPGQVITYMYRVYASIYDGNLNPYFVSMGLNYSFGTILKATDFKPRTIVYNGKPLAKGALVAP